MLWIKSLHIVFVAAWFAVLFYLPRIFVNLAQVDAASRAEYQRLVGMAERLSRFGWVLSMIALGLGVWLWLGFGVGAGQMWLYAKLGVVLLALGYHHACAWLLIKFKDGRNHRSEKWFRWFNEVPVLLLLVAVVLVVVKPQF